jgi:thiol-disulfide isomerase/thioredoxin
MKKNFIIILNLFVAQLTFCQADQSNVYATDPFCRMIETIYSLDALRFNSQFNMKQVFENDTITTYAHVILQKSGTDISFLQIIPDAGNQELILCHDSVWVVNHKQQSLYCVGTNTDHMSYNGMSCFFPFSLFNLDTLISQVEPFWRVILKTSEYSVIFIDINESSADVSDIRVEFTIGNSDFMPYRTLQESLYLKADKLYQEQIFSEYTFPDPQDIKVPDYFRFYMKDVSFFQNMDEAVEMKPKVSPEEVYLNDVKLFDLSGNPVYLPDQGLILLDLWYVGCPPCMKSAPVLEKLYQKYKDQVHFFSINETDHDTAKIIRFKDKMGLSLPTLLGNKGEIAARVEGSGGYPVFILMDGKSRKVLWKFTGYIENVEEIISAAIIKYF